MAETNHKHKEQKCVVYKWLNKLNELFHDINTESFLSASHFAS